MITSKEGTRAVELASKMAAIMRGQDIRTSMFAAMLLVIAVIDQWPGNPPETVLAMKAYMEGNCERLEDALRSGVFGRPK